MVSNCTYCGQRWDTETPCALCPHQKEGVKSTPPTEQNQRVTDGEGANLDTGNLSSNPFGYTELSAGEDKWEKMVQLAEERKNPPVAGRKVVDNLPPLGPNASKAMDFIASALQRDIDAGYKGLAAWIPAMKLSEGDYIFQSEELKTENLFGVDRDKLPFRFSDEFEPEECEDEEEFESVADLPKASPLQDLQAEIEACRQRIEECMKLLRPSQRTVTEEIYVALPLLWLVEVSTNG